MEALLKKLKFKGNGVVVNAPDQMKEKFEQNGFSTILANEGNANVLVFVMDKQECLGFLQTCLKALIYDTPFWIAYPKQSSKVKSDINRDSLWELAQAFGIETVTAISIDETWSALRFRPFDRVGR